MCVPAQPQPKLSTPTAVHQPAHTCTPFAGKKVPLTCMLAVQECRLLLLSFFSLLLSRCIGVAGIPGLAQADAAARLLLVVRLAVVGSFPAAACPAPLGPRPSSAIIALLRTMLSARCCSRAVGGSTGSAGTLAAAAFASLLCRAASQHAP